MENIVVVKWGTNAVVDECGPREERIAWNAHQIKNLVEQGAHPVVVSSGAIALGQVLSHGLELSEQEYAMLGAPWLLSSWQNAFYEQKLLAGALQVTHNEIDDKEEGVHFRNVLTSFISNGLIPVINENDALTNHGQAEKLYGRNCDGLAAHIAVALGASALLLLTDQRGLLRANEQYLVREVPYSAEEHKKALSYAHGPSNKGRGGMLAKVRAGLSVTHTGTAAYIARYDVAFRRMLGENFDPTCCTYFVPNTIKDVE